MLFLASHRFRVVAPAVFLLFLLFYACLAFPCFTLLLCECFMFLSFPAPFAWFVLPGFSPLLCFFLPFFGVSIPYRNVFSFYGLCCFLFGVAFMLDFLALYAFPTLCFLLCSTVCCVLVHLKEQPPSPSASYEQRPFILGTAIYIAFSVPLKEL